MRGVAPLDRKGIAGQTREMCSSLVRSIASAALAMAVAGLGCASLARVDPDETISLDEGEGLVVLHVDTDVEVRRLSGGTLGSVTFAESLPVGESIWMARMAEGEYAWSHVEIEISEGRRFVYELGPGASYRFTVEAGKINYPGQLSVRLSEDDATLRADRRDRSGYAIRWLRETHESLLARLPARYAGPTRHDFLEYFTRARSAALGGVDAADRTGEP